MRYYKQMEMWWTSATVYTRTTCATCSVARWPIYLEIWRVRSISTAVASVSPCLSPIPTAFPFRLLEEGFPRTRGAVASVPFQLRRGYILKISVSFLHCERWVVGLQPHLFATAHTSRVRSINYVGHTTTTFKIAGGSFRA